MFEVRIVVEAVLYFEESDTEEYIRAVAEQYAAMAKNYKSISAAASKVISVDIGLVEE